MTAKKTNPFAEIAALPSTIGDVSAFVEVQNEIDELRAKMLKLIKTTTCSSVETADAHLAKAMSSLEDYFEWAGCYDDEPEVKALTRESIDKQHENLLKRIRESKEPIKVRGILTDSYDGEIKPEIHEDGIDPDPDDWETQSKFEGQPTSKIEKYFVIVCEEDYKYSIMKSEWDKYLNAKKVQIVNDAADPDESFIWKEEWIVKDGDYSLYDNLHSLVGRETLVMTKTLIVEGDF